MSSQGNFNPEDFVDEEYAEEAFLHEGMEEYVEEGLNEEDYDHMAEFEDMLEDDEPLDGSLSRQGSDSSAISSHDRDTWYPECRNCPCCHGMKHGCGCIKVGVDACANPDCVDKEFAAQVTKSINERQAQEVADPNPKIRGNHVFTREMGAILPRSTQTPQVCKFFEAGNCTFGDSCRNFHPHHGSSFRESGGVVQTSLQQCVYFAQGNCNKGKSCRFGHF